MNRFASKPSLDSSQFDSSKTAVSPSSWRSRPDKSGPVRDGHYPPGVLVGSYHDLSQFPERFKLWDEEKLTDALKLFRQEMGNNYWLLAKHSIDANSVTDRRTHKGDDLFDGVAAQPVPPHKEDTLRVKIKISGAGKQSGIERAECFTAIRIKTVKKAAPLYYSHPIEVENNVVASQTPMAFYPYKGDTVTAEKQKKQDEYFKELNEVDNHQLGPIKLDQKRGVIINSERVSQVSLYLDTWLDKLNIEGLNKWTIWWYIILDKVNHPLKQTPEHRDAMEARCKVAIPHRSLGQQGSVAVTVFKRAWDRVFKEEHTKHGVQLGRIDLMEVVCRNGEIDAILNPRFVPRAAPQNAEYDRYAEFESRLETYSSLGCLICFRHSCEHGFYTDDNTRERFSLEKGVLARRLVQNLRHTVRHIESENNSDPCDRRCYLDGENQNFSSDKTSSQASWTTAEQQVLQSMLMSFTSSLKKVDPMCHIAALLDRDCADVFQEAENLELTSLLTCLKPAPSSVEVRNLKWYNRHTKKLSKRPGEANHHIPNWDHINREMDDVCSMRGCDHDGPCEPSNLDCPCASRGQLCEKFCGCTAETCALKFTGCSCRLQGKSCTVKGEECICIQLNRECDPDLCGSCGVVERADPVNAGNDELHSTGCQNCSLQRGVHKKLALGHSQFHGFGLFAAEDIKKDQFIIEYVGELVSGEEGDRRYIRRQNVFEDAKPLSFNFTLLKSCVVWVDGARYGNLSRYVNHASGSNSKCNVSPKILLVNGGFRIAFRAKRSIKAWEELLFDYGEDFGIDTDIEKGKKSMQAHKTARKNAPVAVDSGVDVSVHESAAESDEDSSAEEEDMFEDEPVPEPAPRKRKRGQNASSDEDAYEPPSSNDAGRGGSLDESDTAPRLSNRLRNKGNAASPPKSSLLMKRQETVTTVRTGAKGRPRKVPISQVVSDVEPTPTPELRPDSADSEDATPRKASRRRHVFKSEISDSEDDVPMTFQSMKPASEAASMRKNDVRALPKDYGHEDMEEDENVRAVEDGEEDIQNSFDEVEDSADDSSPRRDQPVRERRQPAKFENSEIYGLNRRKRRRNIVSDDE